MSETQRLKHCDEPQTIINIKDNLKPIKYDYSKRLRVTKRFLNEQNPFNQPYSIVIDRNDSMYVSNVGSNQIQKIDSLWNNSLNIPTFQVFGLALSLDQRLLAINQHPTDNQYEPISIFDEFGELKGKFGQMNSKDRLIKPMNICIDHNSDQVYVSDIGNGSIQVFNTQGEYIQRFEPILQSNILEIKPIGLAFNSTGHLLIGTSKNGMVLMCDKNQQVIGRIKSLGGGPLFDFDFGVDHSSSTSHLINLTVDRFDRLIVCDNSEMCLCFFETDLSLIRRFGDNEGMFSNPTCVSIDSQENLIICEQTSDQISVLSGSS